MQFPLIKVSYKVNGVVLTRTVGASPGDALYVNDKGALVYVDLLTNRSTAPTKEYPDGYYKFDTGTDSNGNDLLFVEMVDIKHLNRLSEENDKRMLLYEELEAADNALLEENQQL